MAKQNERELPTKAEMSALWRCIEDGALMNREMRKDSKFTNEQVAQMQEQVRAARSAYLKLNRLRRSMK